jgi:hypothetical protein
MKRTVEMKTLSTYNTEGKMWRKIIGMTIGFLLIALNAFAANGDLIVDGNLGVGTSTPGAKVEVSGNIKLSGASPTYTITNVNNPINDSDVATKAYVDAAGVRSTTGVNGSAVLTGTFSLTGDAGVYQDTGLSVALPSAGTYFLSGKVRAAWQIYNYGASGSDIAPTMTGFTTPSPNVVSSSGEYGSVYYSWNLFSHSTSGYEGLINSATGYVQLDLGSGNLLTVAGYSITGVNSAHASLGANAKNWNLSGSNDGVNWTVLDTQTNQTGWLSLEVRSFSIAAPAAYRYYRWNITTNNGATYAGAQELVFSSNADTFGKISCRLYDVTANAPCGGNTLVTYSTLYNTLVQTTVPLNALYASPGAHQIDLQCSRNKPFNIGWTLSNLMSDGDGETDLEYIQLQ